MCEASKGTLLESLTLKGADIPPQETKAGMIQKPNERWGALLGWGGLGCMLTANLLYYPFLPSFSSFPESKAGMIQKPNERWGALLGFPESKAGMIQRLNERWGALLGWGGLGCMTYRLRQVRRQRRQQVEQGELERWMAILLERQQQTASPPPLLPLIPHQDVPAPASQAAVAAAVGAGRAGKVDGDSPREAAADRITSSSPPPYSPSGRTGAGKPGGSGGSNWSRQS
ncbi:unnamed protein product [Closterium sp. NIES-64]|nr:unnamed protein product [Closterium sp. NIES-64]